jgi:hypothetical protein
MGVLISTREIVTLNVDAQGLLDRVGPDLFTGL